jgi:ubiquinone/menaquinone biosynthesis C-methylase UbiE
MVFHGISPCVAVDRGVVDNQMPDFGFRVMAFMFRVRDFFRPREDIVKEAGLKEGFHVLDYGCGPGGYVKPVADLVGESGRIYALDISPLAIQMIKKIVAKNQMRNVETIISDCSTGLPDDGVDAVLLYDVFHDLTDPNGVLEELYRVLKPDGVLSFSDHHMKEDEIMSKLTNAGLFVLLKKGKRTYSFAKKQK